MWNLRESETKQSDWFAISDYDVIFTALGGEYKVKQNHCRKLGVLPSFRVRTFLKYKNVPELMILKVRKDCSWLSYARSNVFIDHYATEEKEAALSLFCELGISSQDQFCLEIEVNLWRIKGKQIFSKTGRATKLTWQGTLHFR